MFFACLCCLDPMNGTNGDKWPLSLLTGIQGKGTGDRQEALKGPLQLIGCVSYYHSVIDHTGYGYDNVFYFI